MLFERLILPVLFLFLILSIYFTFTKKWMYLMGLLIISFGLGAFNALYGTLWFPYKMVMIPIILYTFFNIKFTSIPVINNYFLILLFSVLVAWVAAPATQGLNLLQGPVMRPIVQLYSYAGFGLLASFIVFVINSKERLQLILKIYFRLSEIVILIGIIHLIFLILNIDFLPVLRAHGKHSIGSAFSTGDAIIYRIYGLSGEPKTLATFVIPYLFISVYNYIEQNININKIYHIGFLMASLLVIIYTFSSAILISTAVSIALITYFFKNRIGNRIFKIIAVIALIGFIVSEINNLYIQNSGKTQQGLFDVLIERSFGRVEKEADERPEGIALNYIKETPGFLITGVGLGMYNYHLPLGRFTRGVDNINSGWIVILMDFGLIGLLFFLYLFSFLIKLKKENDLYYGNNVFLNSFLIGTIVGFTAHLGVNALYVIFLFLGLALAARKILSESIQK